MRRRLLAFTLSLVMLAACGDDSATQSQPAAKSQSSTQAPASTSPSGTDALAPTSTDASGASTVAPTAPEALQFAAPLLGGGTLDFTTYAGRTVALWFWAPT